MRAVLAVLHNTFREIVRQRLFALILTVNTAVVAVMVVFPYFAFTQETDMFKDLALGMTTLAMVFLVALVASSTLAEELESRTALTVLSKPISRPSFLVGKYLGVLASLLLATVITGAVLFLAAYLRVYNDATPYQRHFAFSLSGSDTARAFQATMWNQGLVMLPGAVMIFYQGAVLAAVAVVLSSRFSRVLAVIVTFGLFLAGHLTDFLTRAVRESPDPARLGVTWSAHLLPFLETFNITGQLAHKAPAPGQPDFIAIWSYTGMSGLYAAAYVAFVLLVGAALFGRKELD